MGRYQSFMKRILLLAALLGMMACTHASKVHLPNGGYSYSGVVEGMVLSNCVCCSGYVLTIAGNDTEYRFDHFPAGCTLDTTKFPINVDLNFTEGAACNSIHRVVITAITKAD